MEIWTPVLMNAGQHLIKPLSHLSSQSYINLFKN